MMMTTMMMMMMMTMTAMTMTMIEKTIESSNNHNRQVDR